MRQTLSRFSRIVLTRLAIPTAQYTIYRRAVLVCGSFLVLALISALLFVAPLGLTQRRVAFGDAWFLTVSALTASGLQSVDIQTVLTPLGYGVLTLLLHIGGVGMMSIVLTLMQQFGIRVFRSQPISGWRLLAGAVVIELWVTALLFLSLPAGTMGWERAGTAFWYASNAFANAGFASPLPQSAQTAGALITLTTLLGSLGFPILVDVVTRKRRLPQTILNLGVMALLVGIGAIAVGISPSWQAQHTGAAALDLSLAAVGDAIQWRTAGVTSEQHILSLPAGTRATLLLLLFLGCAPGAMGGGVTPTTFVVFVAGVIRMLKGDPTVTVMGQRLPPTVIQRASLIIAAGVGLVVTTTGILALVDAVPIDQAFLLATAAFATSNVDVTPLQSLTPLSTAALSIAMLWGRIGVFAIVLTLYGRTSSKHLHTQPYWLA
jgi:trk system potassium uptake protein TrkH